MRFILVLALSLTLLILVEAAPNKNLRRDLRRIAEHTDYLLEQDYVRFALAAAKLFVDNKSDPSVFHNWQHFIDLWDSQNERYSMISNTKQLINHFMQITPPAQLDENIRNAYMELNNTDKKRSANRIAEFETKANEMIRMAKKAGYSDDSLDKEYSRFALDKDEEFSNFLSYLQESS